MGGDDLALLDHVRHHVAVRAARLHVRPQQVARAQVHDAKLLDQLCALRMCDGGVRFAFKYEYE